MNMILMMPKKNQTRLLQRIRIASRLMSLYGLDFVKVFLQREWKISSGLLEDWT